MAGAPLGDTLVQMLKEREVESVAGDGWYVRVTGPRTAAEAERRLYGDLGSPIDTRLDIVLHRRLSRPVSRTAVALGISPNPITIASGVVGLIAAGVVALGTPAALIGGLLLYVLAVVLDHADGEVARLTLTESVLGEWLDVGDRHGRAHHAGAGARCRRRPSRPAAVSSAGSIAAVGILVSASSASSGPRRPASARRNVLDRLTSRDGFYVDAVAVRRPWDSSGRPCCPASCSSWPSAPTPTGWRGPSSWSARRS